MRTEGQSHTGFKLNYENRISSYQFWLHTVVSVKSSIQTFSRFLGEGLLFFHCSLIKKLEIRFIGTMLTNVSRLRDICSTSHDVAAKTW